MTSTQIVTVNIADRIALTTACDVATQKHLNHPAVATKALQVKSLFLAPEGTLPLYMNVAWPADAGGLLTGLADIVSLAVYTPSSIPALDRLADLLWHRGFDLVVRDLLELETMTEPPTSVEASAIRASLAADCPDSELFSLYAADALQRILDTLESATGISKIYDFTTITPSDFA